MRRRYLTKVAPTARKAGTLLIAMNLVLPGAGIKAEPPAKTGSAPTTRETRKATESGPARARLIESANGWMYVNGEWVHPDGYKFLNNKVVRTTAKTGRAFPKPPGKLAQENPTKLAPRTKSAADDTRTPAEKAAEMRQKNLTPTAAPQTGTHL